MDLKEKEKKKRLRKQIDIDKWRSYYQNKSILKKIAHRCKYREVCILRHTRKKTYMVRPLKIFKPEHLEFWLNRLDLYDMPFDLYISNASIKLPRLSNDLGDKKYEQKKISKLYKNPEKITGYDLFVDIDAVKQEDIDKTTSWGRKIKEILENQGFGKKMPIELWKTGSGGVHVVLKGRFTPGFVRNKIMDICCHNGIPMSIPVKKMDGKKYIPENREWTEISDEDLQEKEFPKRTSVDTLVWDSRRIRRVPYSLHSCYGKAMTKIR